MNEPLISPAVQNLIEELQREAETYVEETSSLTVPVDTAASTVESEEVVEVAQEEKVSEPIITPNPPIYNELTSRFSSAIWYNKVRGKFITLAGCGGIGSYVGFLLGRMRPALLHLFDPDMVEEANLSGQLFTMADVGTYKVAAVRNLIQRSSEHYNVYVSTTPYHENSATQDIMICGFDNMEARKLFFHKWLDHTKRQLQKEECLFIDGRLAAEEFQVFAITGDNEEAIKRYEEDFLFSDEEAEGVLCSYKQTSYMANMIASVMVNIFTNFCANECDLPFPREVPFLTSYRADFMDFKVER